MIFLSLGAGVQSSVMLMRAIAGDIERPDHVIFADTGWEPAAVMEHLEWLRRQCESANIRFHLVKSERGSRNIREDMVAARSADSGEYSGNWASMPLFIDSGKGVAGRIKRQCSKDYKLDPIKKKLRELLGYKKGARIPPGNAVSMIGISVDEARRAAPSRDKWIDNVYPLIDPLKMTRGDCQSWWDQHFPDRLLSKSACIGCPFRSDREWASMAPEEFEDACVFDEQIRKVCGKKGDSYLHRSLKPLRIVDFGAKQMEFDFEDELYCSGGCGL